jgi:hypothetical protein
LFVARTRGFASRLGGTTDAPDHSVVGGIGIMNLMLVSVTERTRETPAFGFAVAVGVFFGFYPARRAAALNPIDALRCE